MINKELYKWIIPCGTDKIVPKNLINTSFYRGEVAKLELAKTSTPPSKDDVIKYVNEFLNSVGMMPTCFDHASFDKHFN